MQRTVYAFFVASAALWGQVSPTINQFPSREFGHPKLLLPVTSGEPNLVEGRELNGPSSIAFDYSVNPPILYVADTFNNRVLAFQDPDKFTTCGLNNPGCGFATLAIGQRDLISTLGQGPGTALSAGLLLPSAVAVDGAGNLYVVDAGNNRILRFPQPLQQTGSLLTTDLVIGQTGISSGNQANQGQNRPTAQTLAFFTGNFYRSSLALDSSGNLWASDPGNNRVLRFPAAQLKPNTVQPSADLVLGQVDFVSNGVQTNGCARSAVSAGNGSTQLCLNVLAQPFGLAFDSSGALYVADGFSRVLYFVGPFSNGLQAARVLGMNPVVTQQNQQPLPYPNQYTLGNVDKNGNLIGIANGVFVLGRNLFVADLGANRVVAYDVPSKWPAETLTQPSPANIGFVGQSSNSLGLANKGNVQADATSMNLPVSGAFLGTELWVVDSGNNRVTAFSQQSALTYSVASRLVGQLDFPYDSVNLIEGKEVFFFLNGNGFAGLAVDHNSNPPHLYIADSQNNRILGFNDYRAVQQGSKADLVIGQPNLYTSVINYPGGPPPQLPNPSGLFSPVGVIVDANGNLWVADLGNGRVLRFPAPFSQPSGAMQTANLELGQASYFGPTVKDASQSTMHSPFGLALFADGSLGVSDSFHNRVLIFKRPQGGDFSNGQAAAIVLGQPDFTTILPAQSISGVVSPSGMNSPRHIAVDNGDRLYVCDGNDNRLMVYTNTTHLPNGAASVFQVPNLSEPQGVIVSQNTGEVWVAATNNNTVYRLPAYETLILNPQQVTATLPSTVPLAMTLDVNDNVIVAEASNRVTFYYAQLTYRNAASSNQAGLAPGMLTYIGQLGKDFNLATNLAQTLPWPPSMSGIQVLVNGTAAPIYAVNNGAPYIWFEVPMNAPTSGNVDVQVYRPATGEILADALLPAVAQNPGFLTLNAQGFGQVLATNFDEAAANCSPQPDCYVNSQSNPVARGSTVIFCLTGQGFIPGAGADGAAPPSAQTTLPLVVITSSGVLDPSAVQYSGLGCGYPGLWQINLQVPLVIPPGPPATKIVLTLNDTPSNVGPAGQLTTTFWVK